MSGVRIGIDVGGTKVDAVVLDPDNSVLARHRLPVARGSDGVIESVCTAAEQVCAQAGIAITDVTSVGVGIPGAVRDGVVEHALNLDIDRLDLGVALHRQWGLPVAVENDVNVAALGAARLLASPADSVAYLNVGTGLAAGIILGGRLWRGVRGAAGEIGHISINPDGPVGADGLAGGLETYASGSGMVQQWGVSGAHAEDVLAAAATGDSEALRIRRGLLHGVATAVRVLILTLDVDRVLLGGGLTGLGDELLAGVRDVIAEWEQASPFLASLELGERIVLVPNGDPIAAIGAAHLEVRSG